MFSVPNLVGPFSLSPWSKIEHTLDQQKCIEPDLGQAQPKLGFKPFQWKIDQFPKSIPNNQASHDGQNLD